MDCVGGHLAGMRDVPPVGDAPGQRRNDDGVAALGFRLQVDLKSLGGLLAPGESTSLAGLHQVFDVRFDCFADIFQSLPFGVASRGAPRQRRTLRCDFIHECFH